MLKQFDIYLRLVACMLVSVAAHAMLGLTGVSDFGPSSRASGTVEVALVTAKQHKTPAFQAASQPVSPQQVERLQHQSAARKLPVVTAPTAESETRLVTKTVDSVPSPPKVVSPEPRLEPEIRLAEMGAGKPQTVLATTPGSKAEESRTGSSGTVDVTEQFTDAIPAYLSNPVPDYPRLARRRSWQGVVWLLVEVTSTGDVADLAVEQSSGYRILDQAAFETVRSWTFVPARSGGVAVASQVRVPVEFVLEGS